MSGIRETPAPDWRPIDQAPKDGTEVELTWMEDGNPAKIYPMRWNRFASNPLVQEHKGIWVMHSRVTNEIFMTWSEADPDGAPTHWRPVGSGRTLADANQNQAQKEQG